MATPGKLRVIGNLTLASIARTVMLTVDRATAPTKNAIEPDTSLSHILAGLVLVGLSDEFISSH
jgi:hypothetical protein